MIVWPGGRIRRSVSLMYLRTPRENVRNICMQLPGIIYLQRNQGWYVSEVSVTMEGCPWSYYKVARELDPLKVGEKQG